MFVLVPRVARSVSSTTNAPAHATLLCIWCLTHNALKTHLYFLSMTDQNVEERVPFFKRFLSTSMKTNTLCLSLFLDCKRLCSVGFQSCLYLSLPFRSPLSDVSAHLDQTAPKTPSEILAKPVSGLTFSRRRKEVRTRFSSHKRKRNKKCLCGLMEMFSAFRWLLFIYFIYNWCVIFI